MKLFSDIIRAAALAAALYAFFIHRTSAAIFILVTFFIMVILRFRRPILLTPTRELDKWEFFAVLLFFVNGIILVSGLYYTPQLWFIDILLHFWGGMIVGLWAYFIFFQKENLEFQKADWLRKMIIILGTAALVGIGWEFFEWIMDHTISIWYVFPKNQPSVDDNMKDLLMDLLGGVLVGFITQWRDKAGLEILKKMK